MCDLTHDVHDTIPFWDDGCGFQLHINKDYPSAGCRVHRIEMLAGVGTHIDAPNHFIPGGKDIASIQLENLLVPACVINISTKMHQDYYISIDDVLNYEQQYGKIKQNSLVIAYTGWSQFWNDPIKYRNKDEKGIMHFPGFSVGCIELLLERNIAGIAIDTLSPDGSNYDFPAHHLLLKEGLYIIENIANANLLPAEGSFIIALPIKIKGGTEAPLRMIGIRPIV